jgi:translation initiation factor 4E
VSYLSELYYFKLSSCSGGKFTLRLVHPITPLLFESLLLALIGDQFDEADCVVGCVLSVRQAEDILSVWVEEEGEGVRSGALRWVSL